MLVNSTEVKFSTYCKGPGLQSVLPIATPLWLWIVSENNLESVEFDIQLENKEKLQYLKNIDRKSKKLAIFYTIPPTNAKRIVISINDDGQMYNFMSDISLDKEPSKLNESITEVSRILNLTTTPETSACVSSDPLWKKNSTDPTSTFDCGNRTTSTKIEVTLEMDKTKSKIDMGPEKSNDQNVAAVLEEKKKGYWS
ncbi:unnamed protein product [Caenorhabditis angaria]|uniref:Uncharacterized protein n=1 Tax=Caenorhabditis angaria TaxID=860376 RepID=A0A9P1IKD0_9PELO|nr:unnamed protein product [Caenorhabditis angaria]